MEWTLTALTLVVVLAAAPAVLMLPMTSTRPRYRRGGDIGPTRRRPAAGPHAHHSATRVRNDLMSDPNLIRVPTAP